MSEAILNAQEIFVAFSLILLISWVIYLIVSATISLIIIYYRDKKVKLEEERSQVLQDKIDRTNEILSKPKSMETVEELEGSNSKFSERVKGINEQIGKENKKISIAEEFKVLKYLIIMVMIFSLIVCCAAYSEIGGSFGDMHAVEYQEQGVNITAYYDITYKNSDQKTLSVFVKNNSGKRIQSLVVKQKGTSNKSTLYNVDPGQEKIVTIDSYTNSNYEFEIEDIQFIE